MLNIRRIDSVWCELTSFAGIGSINFLGGHMQKVASRIGLVTGANKGIGFEIARQLGKEGMTILLGARDPSLGKAATDVLKNEGIDVRYVQIDLEAAASIEAAAQWTESEFGRIDLLVNNAGVTDPSDGAPSVASASAVQRIMGINFFGTLAVTQAFLPLLRKSTSGRVVNLSSGLGSLTLNDDPDWEFAKVKLLGYNASKAAVNMLTIQLAYELRDTAIKVNSADPGFTATDLNGHRGYQTVPQGAAEAVRLALLPDDGPTGTFSSSNGPNPW